MSLNQDLLDKLVLSYFGQNKEIVKLFNDITKKYSCLFIHYILTIYIDNYKLKTEHLEVESMNDLKDESKFKYKEIEKELDERKEEEEDGVEKRLRDDVDADKGKLRTEISNTLDLDNVSLKKLILIIFCIVFSLSSVFFSQSGLGKTQTIVWVPET